MPIDRRSLLLSSLAASACARLPSDKDNYDLIEDPSGILDLPAGFRYQIISEQFQTMSDGLRVPARADGMAAFAGPGNEVILVRNHENLASQNQYSAFGDQLELYDRIDPTLIYDRGGDKLPGTGGTTTLTFDTRQRRVTNEYLSLAGTELNCAGGPTPWATWLSCEECFSDKLRTLTAHFPREKPHGLVFEVDPFAGKLEPPKPLPALGRFVHEACAVDPLTGIVYLTEDRHDGLLYRLLPTTPGKLENGGRLQALAFADPQRQTTDNQADPLLTPNDWYPCRWIDMAGVDSAADDLRQRGYEAGAARFVRGEGMWQTGGEVIFACTAGGAHRLGQIFRLRDRSTGPLLSLLAESEPDSVLHHADNLASTPAGDLVVCEDRSDVCGLVIVRPNGQMVRFAQHRRSDSELAGVCFAPDASLMFVNIQSEGLTLAISGPFRRLGIG